MKRLCAALMVLVSLGLLNPVLAANPSGTWRSTFAFRTQQVENAFRLRLDSEGPIWAGVYSDGLSNRPTALQSLTLKDNTISFAVAREAGGEKFNVKFNGQLQGDKIVGTAVIDFGNRTQTGDWVATRLK